MNDLLKIGFFVVGGIILADLVAGPHLTGTKTLSSSAVRLMSTFTNLLLGK